MTTTTWTAAPIRACWLAAGDRVELAGHTVFLIEAVDHIHFVSLVGESPDVYVVANPHPFAEIAIHVPDQPVDGYNLLRPPTGFWPHSGCTCVHRRDADGNWAPVTTDPDCRGCRVDLDEED